MIRLVLACLLLTLPARALELSGQFVEGGLISGQTRPGAIVTLNDQPIRVDDRGRFTFGIGHGQTGKHRLLVKSKSGEQNHDFTIPKRSFPTQRISGLPPKMVTPPQEVLDRIRRENSEIARIRGLDSEGPASFQGFIRPSPGIISGVFGAQRILNDIPKRPHFGIDIAAPAGTPVIAPAGGIVRMAEQNLYYTGGTIMIDHGHGLVTVLSHLKDIEAKVGDQVQQGDRVGTVGSTGRSTGPHLDWRVNWFKARLDPGLLIKE